MNSYLLILITMVLWGLYPIATHYYVLQLDPIFLVSISTLISSIPFVIKLVINKNTKKIFSGKIFKYLLLTALFEALGAAFLFVGTKLTTGINTGLLLQVEPIYSLVLGVLLFKEVFDKKRIGATTLMVLGAIVIVYKGFVSPNIGDIFILLTPLMFQISHGFVKKLLDRGEDMTIILTGRQLLGGLMLIIFAFIYNPSFVKLLSSPKDMGVSLYLGFYLSITLIFWYSAVRKMSLSAASSFLPITAFIALLGGAIFLKEAITAQHYAGLILIVSGMLWLSRQYSNAPTKKT